ncbi:hypothetical protein [Candidatus Marithrix sp. Canyon 246]|uniref:hypothetical protein n=1 Tax=Candidatus Marithrix sp. Canyon 246 TaxID=1827136 RepID=UPI00084A2C4A|nr:hypothetical protein [Candidatus Marithrix sp. Canyon 246]
MDKRIFYLNTGELKEIHTLATPTGLFHPLVLDQERIFAYQFTNQGLQHLPTLMMNFFFILNCLGIEPCAGLTNPHIQWRE